MKILSSTHQLKMAACLIIGSAIFSSAKADLTVVVHPDNPVAELSARQVSKIFMGRLRMFPETELETEVLDQDNQLPSFEEFYKKLVRMNPSKLKRYRASYLFTGQGSVPQELENETAVKAYVASHPSAIGYIDSQQVDDSVKVIYSFDK